MFLWVVAQLAEHRTVTADSEGSTPFDPPNSFSILDFRLPIGSMRDDLDCPTTGQLEIGQSAMFGTVAER